MALVLKSNQVATASLGNVNGIKGSQDWVIFLDFENEIYQTKSAGTISQNYSISDVVSVSRSNLAGNPITISRNGIEKNITSLTEIRTALLRNKHFGLLVEDLNENFFRNSDSPVTQVVSLPASTQPIVVSCIGSGQVVVSGDVIGTGQMVVENTPKIFKRNNTSSPLDLSVTVTGTLSHVQVELATGAHTASSKVTTGATSATRAREIAKLKQNLVDSLITDKSKYTVVVQTVDYNRAMNNPGYDVCSRLSLENSNTKMMVFAGNGLVGNYYGQSRSYIDNALDKNPSAIQLTPLGTPIAFTQAVSFNGTDFLGATNGVVHNPINATSRSLDQIMLGPGYGSPIGVNGLRGIVTKLVVYNRVLSAADLVEISKSW